MAQGKTRTTSEDDGVTLPPVDAKALKAKAWTMYERVVEAYGHQPNVPRREPMHELISTILSHRTTGKNEDVAYERMRSRWTTWEEVRDAPTAELAEAIAPSNFADQKAPRIQAVLRRIIEERGEADIEFLRDMPLTDAMAWLTALPGVGPKTATLVLLFCFARPVLPVDTHVHRVSQRVGLIGSKVDPTAAHPLLLALFPEDPQILYNFHIDTLRHGQQICTWSNPKCGRCVLNDLCDYYAAKQRAS